MLQQREHPFSADRYQADRELIYGRPLSVENCRVVYTVWDVEAQRRLPQVFATLDAAAAYAARLNETST